MRFLADMGISPRAVEWLRAQGHDAVHLHEEGLGKLPDEKVFEKAARERRVLLTSDLDFGEIVARSKGRAVGIVLFRMRSMAAQSVIARLRPVLAVAGALLEEGAIVTVEESRHRIRRLPVGG